MTKCLPHEATGILPWRKMGMAHELKSITLSDGRVENEKACMNYTCRYCGAKATGANFVAGLCLQVVASHVGLCGAYVESDQYTGYVSECSTCRYFEDGKCQHEKDNFPASWRM